MKERKERERSIYVESQKAKIFLNLKQIRNVISSIERTLTDLPEEEEEFRIGPIGVEQISRIGWNKEIDSRVTSIYFGGKIIDIPTVGRGEELSLQLGLKEISGVKSLVEEELEYIMPKVERKERLDVRIWSSADILFREELNPLRAVGALWFIIFGGITEDRAREIIEKWGLPFSLNDRNLFLKRKGRIYPKALILSELGVQFEVLLEEEGVIKKIKRFIKREEKKEEMEVVLSPEVFFVDGFEEREPIYNPTEEMGTLLFLSQKGCPYSERVSSYLTHNFRNLALQYGIRIRRAHAYNNVMVGLFLKAIGMKQTPTFLALNKYLEEFDRKEGYLPPESLMRWIKELGEKLRWKEIREGTLY